MRGSMLDRVRSFVERLAPAAVCDDCITDRLGLAAREDANRKTRELAGTAGFERRIGKCSLCEIKKTVIHRKAS